MRGTAMSGTGETRRWQSRVTVVLADDHPIWRTGVRADLGENFHVVGEALTNAVKHGGAGGVTVYAEPTGEGGVFVSVKDDGCGFDPAATPEGEGLTRSIRGRLAEVGGRVEVDGRPGRGTEIRLYL